MANLCLNHRWALGLLILVLGLSLHGCSPQGQALETDAEAAAGEPEKAGDEDRKKEDLPTVEVVALGRGSIEAMLRFSTNLEAESEVEVFSQASRLVTELLVEEGDRVRKGQVLLRLQDDEQKSELARVESQLRKARRELERQKNLYAQELISEQVWNEATYELEQLELAFEDARRNLGYTEVRAPISGTVTGRHVNLGDHITINQHLFDLVDFDSIVARIYVPERELVRLRVEQTARLLSDSMGGQARLGRVLRIAPIVDPKSGTVKVTVAIPRNQGLLPGIYVEVELVTDVHEDALLVPKPALIYDNNEAFVYRLSDEMRVERLRLAVLLEDQEHVEPAPDSGLEVGDEIVVKGQAGLKHGVRVRRVGEAPAAVEPSGESS